MKVKSNNIGKCPFCNNEGTLDYGAVEFEGEMCYFPWHGDYEVGKDLSCMTCFDLDYFWYEDEDFINE